MIIRNSKTKGRGTAREIVLHNKGNVTWIDDVTARRRLKHFIVFPHEPISQDQILPLLTREFGLTKPATPKKPK
jgi:hypothetical protein